MNVLVPLESPHLLYALPAPASTTSNSAGTQFVFDLLYGGLRAEDSAFCYHVTPSGEARARRTDDAYAPPPTDLTVKHTLESFADVEDQNLLSPLTALLQRRFGDSAYQPLFTLERPPQLSTEELGAALKAYGLAPLLPGAPHRAAGDEQKKRATADRLKNLLLSQTSSSKNTALDSHRIFLRHSDGNGLELFDHADRNALLRQLLVGSDLVNSDVVPIDKNARTAHLVACGGASSEQTARHVGVNAVRNASLLGTTLSVPQLIHNITSSDASLDHPTEKRPSVTVMTFGPRLTSLAYDGDDFLRKIASGIDERLPLARQCCANATGSIVEALHQQRQSDTTAERHSVTPTIELLHQSLQRLRAPNANVWATESGGVLDHSNVQPFDIAHIKATSTQPRKSNPHPEQPQHANPTASSPTKVRTAAAASATVTSQGVTLPSSSTTTRRNVLPTRLVATPALVEFGTLMEGFRYTSSLQLTNMGLQACRFRVEVPHHVAPWLSIDYSKQPIAAGMSIPLVIELNGYQPSMDLQDVSLNVVHEGGSFPIQVSAFTRTSDDRPVSQQRKGVRMIGPSILKYVPGTSSS